MNIHFYKYQGAGNDFVIADNREAAIQLTKEQVAFLCDRRFGIGADGLMLLENADGYDFRMVYFNSDGNESTMCGNGGRCIAAFALKLGVAGRRMRFVAIDGPHDANIDEGGTVHLAMQNVSEIDMTDSRAILNTGSPHYVKWVDDVDATDVFTNGRSIRNQDEFQPKGINVNFVQRTTEGIKVRTYERGVEDETLSCGTGVTAAAIASAGSGTGQFETNITTPGGLLKVSFLKEDNGNVSDVILSGPAVLVFEGEVKI